MINTTVFYYELLKSIHSGELDLHVEDYIGLLGVLEKSDPEFNAYHIIENIKDGSNDDWLDLWRRQTLSTVQIH
tara:strand:+ start:447 stop:668 length:222 start_codon:yes stop_codon:yes gene_type:complete